MGTRAQLETRIIETFKRDDKTTELRRAINDTLYEMAGCIQNRKTTDQRWMPLVIGEEAYAVPSDILRVNHPIRLIDTQGSSSDSTSYNMDFINKDEYDALCPYPNSATTDTGKPYKYAIWKNCILVYPIPDKVYRIEINLGAEIVVLNADADTSIFQDRWDETIATGALSRLFAGIQLYDEAKYWREIYINGQIAGEGTFSGGLKLLRELENAVTKAPKFVAHTNF